MNIKLVLYIVILLLGFFFTKGQDHKGLKKKGYIIIIISLLVMESSLRSVYVGPDTINYYSNFLEVSHLSWNEVWESFTDSYLKGEGKDPGYLVFVKGIQFFSVNYNVFLFFCALVFFVPLGLILYRYSTSVLQLVFAFTLYVSLFHIVALSGVRQQLATGFCFMSFLQLDKRHNWRALLIIILAATVHISALLFLLVPSLKLLTPRLLKSLHLISFATIPFVIVFAAPIMLFLASLLANDYYSGYAEAGMRGSAILYILLMELLSLFCYCFISTKSIICRERTKLLYVMLPLLTVTVPLISLNGAMIRIGQYFTLYMMLLVPMAIDSIGRKINPIIVYYVMIAFLLFLSMRSGDFDYYFFWQLSA